VTSAAPLASLPAEAALPLPAEQARSIEALAAGLSSAELDQASLWWLSGYAAGLARARAPLPANALAQPVAETVAPQRLTILYGSQTGNARRMAEQLAAQSEAAGASVRLLRADAYQTRELKDETQLYIVISTQGEGDPPDDAIGLVEFIRGRRAPKLPHLKYAVLGLGDSSYPQFCEMGRVLDERLAELGATRLFERGDADLDIDSVAGPWLERAVTEAKALTKASVPAHSATVTPLRPVAPAPVFDHAHPFAAPLLANQRITASGSRKDVRHIELSLEGSGLRYEPGDALGIHPRNPSALVDEVLEAVALDGDTVVAQGDASLPLRIWLTEKRELTRLARPFIAELAARAGSEGLQALLAPGQRDGFARLLADSQVIDLLQQHRAKWSGEQLVAALRPLAPRLYSIASSQKAVGEEVHLTVAHLAYEAKGGSRWGAASHLLACSEEDETLPIYIEANERFRLPADPSRDIIMIGPGTGVAPFRAFVQEREVARPDAGAGRNWLFFGNPHFRSDFLYQLEWQRARKAGLLDRIDLAFSRDGAQKIHVQQRIREQGRRLWDWLQGGAHLYICGAIAMGRGVHEALLEVARAHGALDAEAAADWLRELQQQGRYARDVY
jgi:sulfite reductase (NADPH) flavoprotein alpha-component